MVTLPYKNYYTTKDQLKANQANKFIGLGSERSSTNAYRIAYGNMANTGKYNITDVVFISAEGNRNGRLKPPYNELDKAIKVHVTFITDKYADRQRPYNIGEREVAAYLMSKGYVEHLDGIWEHESYL